jgi:hypothetical protein
MSTESQMPSEVDLELWHRVEAEPEGTFRLFRADRVGTEKRIQQHLSNLDEISSRINHAATSGCSIELISLRLQVIDFWLRVFFSNRAPADLAREREFGRLLRQCFDLGLPEPLYQRLNTFNKRRIDAIHGYIIGATSYETLNPIAADSDLLLREVIVFVVTNSGVVVHSRDELRASPGAMVIHVAGFCAEVMRRRRY